MRNGWRVTGVRAATAGVAGALAVLLGVTGCSGSESGSGSGGGGDGPRVVADHSSALADQAVRISVRGLKAHAKVTVTSRADDRKGQPWGTERQFTADGRGTVRLGARGMELLSGMEPLAGPQRKLRGSGKAFSFHPATPDKRASYTVRLSVRAGGSSGSGGKAVARTDLTRRWLNEDSGHRKLTVARDKVDGELYTPPEGAAKKAPVLVFGGSEGGNAGEYAAALLAAHGHPALSLCYFRCGDGSGRPDAIDMIDLDYFTRAAKLLGRQPGADPERLAVMGNSRGSEAAQLLGQRRPSVVRDVIAYAPSSKVIGPYPTGRAAWADGGKPVPVGPVPLDRVRGTVLAVAGGNDKMWGSAASAKEIASRGGHRLTYAGAGHHVNWFPYGQPGEDGGADGATRATSRADQRAREAAWPRVLHLLTN